MAGVDLDIGWNGLTNFLSGVCCVVSGAIALFEDPVDITYLAILREF